MLVRHLLTIYSHLFNAKKYDVIFLKISTKYDRMQYYLILNFNKCANLVYNIHNI